MTILGRKPVLNAEGKKRSELPPDERGFHQVRLHESLIKRLDEYAKVNNLSSRPAAITHLLENAKTPSD